MLLPQFLQGGGGKKYGIWAQFSMPLAFGPPAFRNGTRCLKSKTNSLNADHGPILPKLGTVRRTPKNSPDVSIPFPLKIGQ